MGGDCASSSKQKSKKISIHTTRVGGDDDGFGWSKVKYKFQSTPPVWVVTEFFIKGQFSVLFQSTPPVWVVTLFYQFANQIIQISIHTTRVGGDPEILFLILLRSISIHTTRVGGDELTQNHIEPLCNISIHTTRVGGDLTKKENQLIHEISIHTTRVGGDLKNGLTLEVI